jgi:thioredoxin reductase (NADPH)
MESLIESWIIYGFTGFFLAGVVIIYILKLRRESRIVGEKIALAKEEGLFEPVSLHPVVDVNSCIQSGACIRACPEKDILGIRNGKATVINASRCIGHGACFHACPTEAITLCIGTEKRGVDLPHVNQYFESNVKGLYIAGEMGGMGLIKNAVEQGKQAVDNLVKDLSLHQKADYDLVVVGAGPAGISASLQARKHKLKCITLEQDSLGGTVFSFPRQKIVMTSPMDLPLHGKVRLRETHKQELLDLWISVLGRNQVTIQEHRKVDRITKTEGFFEIHTTDGSHYTSRKVLLAIGRRGSPRKLGVPGEELPKVFYRLLEPEYIVNKRILVVGGGDSAVESVLMLAGSNEVALSYRQQTFSRLKPKNLERMNEAIASERFRLMLNSNVEAIEEDKVLVRTGTRPPVWFGNDLVYIFAGGELPVEFLKNSGIMITRKFGEAILKHDKR